jgi:multiple antibiotic resistance protein
VPAAEHLVLSIGVAAGALFPIVDPIGNVPTFLSLTRTLDQGERRRQALRAVAASLVILAGALAIGNFVLEYFHISLAAVEVVGGLVLGQAGWLMLSGPTDEPDHGELHADGEIFFTPMAFPLLAGPGALATVLAFSNRADNWLDFPGFLIGIGVVLAATYLILSNADRVLDKLGPRSVEVINRMMGLIVLLIAAELVFHGIADEFGLERFGD